MPSEDNSHAKSVKHHFGSSWKVAGPLDFHDDEAETLNTSRVPSPLSPKDILALFNSKNPFCYAIRQGPLEAPLDGSIRPKDRRKIERFYRNAGSTTGPIEVDLYGRPKLNGGKGKKKISALSDGKNKKKVATKPKTRKV